MSKLRASGTNNKLAGIVKLKTAVGKLHKIGRRSQNEVVPEDVKEGHIAVVAMDGEQLKRFVVPLSCLSHPRFVQLLEQAAEEYGFDHRGALAIPCQPCELERILAEGGDSGDSSDDGANWSWFL